jgi:hypothetical protein
VEISLERGLLPISGFGRPKKQAILEYEGQMKFSKTKTSLYRRAYVTWLINSGVNTVPAIIEATGMPRRTAQDTLKAVPELSIELENQNGNFSVKDWGMLNEKWIEDNLQHVKNVLKYP